MIDLLVISIHLKLVLLAYNYCLCFKTPRLVHISTLAHTLEAYVF